MSECACPIVMPCANRTALSMKRTKISARGCRLKPRRRWQAFSQQSLDFDGFMQLFDVLTQNNTNSRARIQLSPANLHWMSDDGLLAIQEKSANSGAPMHMHLLETAYQKEYAFKRTGTTAVKHLEKLGLLGPHMTLGHGVWMTQEDIEICAGTGTCICHNCSSNFRLRSGVLPLMELQKRGITVGIGIDEAGINDDRDMLQEMRMVLTAHRSPHAGHESSRCSFAHAGLAHGNRTWCFDHSLRRRDWSS